MTISLPQTEIPATKRTRTNVKQSKYGCFTCKARRIKCDEAKPVCRRCLTAKRHCEGYPRGAPTGPSTGSTSTSATTSSSSTPSLSRLSPSTSSSSSAATTPSISFTFNPTEISTPLLDLAARVLAQSPRRARNDLEQAFWSRTVPQLTHTIPSVRAAVEAFGASYKEYVLGSGSSRPGLETAKRYTHALRLAQHDLVTQQHGPVPCIIACLFLAFVEALQQRLDNGHMHLMGAFSLLVSHTKNKLLGEEEVESVSVLLQKLDLHVATYAVSHAPNLPPPPPVPEDVVISDPPDQALSKILHSCYHFTAGAFHYKYISRRLIPPDMLIEQGRQLARLKQWLTYHELPPSWDTNFLMQNESLVVLRAQCLSALIHTACILEPRETAYDCYGPDFEEIIRLMEVLLLNKDTGKTSGGHPGALPSFVPEMGTIQPLYFTAKKYRHPFWRRKALKLLLKSGKEGPWCGETDGSLIAAAIRTEEGLSQHTSLILANLEDTPPDSSFSVPDSQRLNACWTIDPEYENEECSNMSGRRFTKAIMFRCTDIEALLRDEGQQQPRQFPWEGSSHWETWQESLEDVS